MFIMECWDCDYEWTNVNKQCTCPQCGSTNTSNIWEEL